VVIAIFRCFVAAFLLCVVSARAVGGALLLDSAGGDAWTFHKRITGELIGLSCDAVEIATPAGSAPARIEGERFAAVVHLAAGLNRLRAECLREGAPAAVSQPAEWIARLRDVPSARATMVSDGRMVVLDAGASTVSPGSGAEIQRYEWRPSPSNAAAINPTDRAAPLARETPAGGVTLRLKVPRRDGRYGVELRVVDSLGRSDQSIVMFDVIGGRAVPVDLAHGRPRWADDAVVYGVVPQLAGRRGLADVTRRLDDIAALGATAIWLSPVSQSPAGDFGYAVTDHFHVRSSIGGADDLRSLVTAAHARGLKVILDVPANHLSDQHRYYRDAARNGRRSAYADFFAREANGAVTHYFNWTNLENLNLNDCEVRRYLIEAFAHWLRDFDVDGFRVDAAWGIRQRAPDFWPQWRAELKRIKPDILLLAEASERDPYYAANGFDAAYDWTERLGEWAWQGAFDGGGVAAKLRIALSAETKGELVFRFLDNNDTGRRFLTRHGADLTRLASIMLMTLPGLPSVYMGEEIGAAFEPYAARGPIEWQGDAGWRRFYRRVIALRRREPALRSGNLTLIAAERGEDVLVYRRDPGRQEGAPLIVLLNFSPRPARMSLKGDSHVADIAGTGRVLDELGGGIIAVDPADPQIDLPGLSARVLRRVPVH
jgi:cyclomaltodextrinase / maltogenic alpha-amylase / neopullulanase